MPAQYIYNVNGPFATASNVDLSARVRAYQTEMSEYAEEGAVAISTVLVDDEESGINITGFRSFRWKESSESSNSRIIVDGYTADRNISRGPFRVERSRQWAVQVADQNSILQRRIMRGSDANRPAETDVARIQWAVSTTELNLLTDSTYISTNNPVAMDANDYRNQRIADIIDDCAQQSGKNYFLLLNELYDPPRYGLFYDYTSSSAYPSSVRLTNVLADVDADHYETITDPDTFNQTTILVYQTTFAAYNDNLNLNRDPSRLYSAVVVAYNGGDVYVQSDTITNNFVSRDTMSPGWNIKTAAKAQARGLRYLNDIGTEQDRLTMSYLVPLARVNQLKAGHTFQVKFSHLPGYTDWTWVRALNRTVRAESEEFYKVTIEAVPAAAAAATCSTVLSSIITNVYDKDRTGLNASPVSSPVTAPPSYPAIALAITGLCRTGTCLCNTAISIDAPWTTIHKYQTTSYNHQALAVGYLRVTSGTPNPFVVNWTGNTADWATMAVHILTSATAPVQDVSQDILGATLTLTSTPTPGNILVITRIAGTAAGGPITPIGFTQIASHVYTDPHGFHIGIYARCVLAGDGKVWNIDYSYPHWTTMTEWAIT